MSEVMNPAAPADSSATTSEPSQPASGASPESSPAAAVASDPNAAQSPAATGATGQPEVNWKEKFESQERSYNELRRKLQLQGQERNEFRKQAESQTATLKQLAEAVAALQHKDSYDPDQFMEDLRAQGPQYVLGLIQKEREKILADTNAQVNNLSGLVTELRTERAVERRKANKEQYPDFADLEHDMAQVYLANKALFDSQYEDLDEKIDALYNAAKLQRSPDALKQAEALGRKKTEEELAREAHAAGASGGKAGAVSVPDPSQMSASQLREYFAKQGMVKDY